MQLICILSLMYTSCILRWHPSYFFNILFITYKKIIIEFYKTMWEYLPIYLYFFIKRPSKKIASIDDWHDNLITSWTLVSSRTIVCSIIFFQSLMIWLFSLTYNNSCSLALSFVLVYNQKKSKRCFSSIHQKFYYPQDLIEKIS